MFNMVKKIMTGKYIILKPERDNNSEGLIKVIKIEIEATEIIIFKIVILFTIKTPNSLHNLANYFFVIVRP